MSKAIILGCGHSTGVPTLNPDLPAGDWGLCDPTNPKNIRTRSSLYVEFEGTRLLIDTSPDMRQQFLNNQIAHIDAVLFTHDHADHTFGIDELRAIYFARQGFKTPIYTHPEIMLKLQKSFAYLFQETEVYPQIIEPHTFTDHVKIGSASIISFRQGHGKNLSIGLRFGALAYSTDFNELDDQALEALKNLDCWIVDCVSRDGPRPTHCHLDLTLEWISKVKPKRAILTHMGNSLDYETLLNELPPQVEPAYDGMLIEY